jgi:hypothetical protein
MEKRQRKKSLNPILITIVKTKKMKYLFNLFIFFLLASTGYAQTSDTLLVRKKLIGKESILTVILSVPDTAEDLDGSLSFYKTFQANYYFRGGVYSSSLYESALEDFFNGNLSADTKWGKYWAFEPQYLTLASGIVILRTFSISNMFRSGPCGSCDFINETYYQIGSNRNNSKVIFEVETNPVMGGATYRNHTEPGSKEHTFFKEDVLSQPFYATNIWLGQKGWKIMFNRTVDDISTELSPFDLSFKILNQKVTAKLTRIEPQYLKNTP